MIMHPVQALLYGYPAAIPGEFGSVIFKFCSYQFHLSVSHGERLQDRGFVLQKNTQMLSQLPSRRIALAAGCLLRL